MVQNISDVFMSSGNLSPLAMKSLAGNPSDFGEMLDGMKINLEKCVLENPELSQVEGDELSDLMDFDGDFSNLTEKMAEILANASDEELNAIEAFFKGIVGGLEKELEEFKLKISNEEDENADDLLKLSVLEDYLKENPIVAEFFEAFVSAVEVGKSEEISAEQLVCEIMSALSGKDYSGEFEFNEDSNEEFTAKIGDLIASTAYAIALEEKPLEKNISTEKFMTEIGVSVKINFEDGKNSLEKIANVVKVAFSGENLEKSSLQESFAEALNKEENAKFNALKINDASDALEQLKIGAEISTAQIGDGISSNDGISNELNVYRGLSEIALRQLESSILKNTDAKIDEFTVVLRPDSMGEIAVKITEKDDGTLSLILSATNAEVAKAITLNSDSLISGLVKYGSQVDEILVVNPNEAANYMDLDFTNQGFNRKNDEGNPENHRRVTGISSEETTDVMSAEKLLKEAKLWATA